MDKLGSFDNFRAPWETEAGADAEIDKAKLKRLIFNFKLGEAKALDEAEESKAKVAEAEKQRDEAKEEAEKASPEEAVRKIARLETANAALKAENEKLTSEKEISDLRSEVLQGIDPKVAKYVVGTTKEELEKSLADVKADFGITDGDGNDGDDEDEPQVRTRPRPRLTNAGDPNPDDGANQEPDFEAVANSVFSRSY